MATITAQQLVNRVKDILNDSTSVRWPTTQLLEYLNDAQREIVLLRPDASVKNASMSLLASSTKQSIPNDGLRLMTVVRNMGTDGISPGRAIRMVDRAVLDTQVPTWHSDPASNEIMHSVFDPVNPRNFYVYPRPLSSRQVEVIYSSAPSDVNLNQVISIDDIYANGIMNYMFYRAYSKDADYAQNEQLSTKYWNAFVQSIGLKTEVDMSTDPNQRPILSKGMDR